MSFVARYIPSMAQRGMLDIQSWEMEFASSSDIAARRPISSMNILGEKVWSWNTFSAEKMLRLDSFSAIWGAERFSR